MLFDLGQQSNVQFALALTGGQTNANVNSAAIDTRGFSGVGVALIAGPAGAATSTLNTGNALALAFREGDTTAIGASTALSASNLIKSENASALNSVAYYSIRPTKRYVFAEVYKTNAATNFTNVNVAVVGVLGFPHTAPTD